MTKLLDTIKRCLVLDPDIEQYLSDEVKALLKGGGLECGDKEGVSPALIAALIAQLKEAESVDEAKSISESVWDEYP